MVIVFQYNFVIVSSNVVIVFQYDFVAVACETEEMTAVDQQQIIHAITENGWREDTCIRHVTSRSSPPGTLTDDMGRFSLPLIPYGLAASLLELSVCTMSLRHIL